MERKDGFVDFAMLIQSNPVPGARHARSGTSSRESKRLPSSSVALSLLPALGRSNVNSFPIDSPGVHILRLLNDT